jgi:diguanylate cyclase (GGDEF)-like protein/PAS domain S-box-containing protein
LLSGGMEQLESHRMGRRAGGDAELPPPGRGESGPLRELELTCMSNLLSCTAERVYFKDLQSRFLFVSAGWIAACAPDHTAAELIGKTDFDFFNEEHACAAFEDEQQIIRTGEPIIGKLEPETHGGQALAWVSSTKMPLRDESGRIIGTFGISRDVTAQIKAEQALAHQALHDPLTGLPNRIALLDRLSQGLLAMERHPSRLAVLFIDLDNFKEINDSYGHDAGDLVLTEAGRRLSALARRGDTVARLGGDEFVMLCGELESHAAVRLIGDRIIRSIAVPYVEGGRDFSVTCSAGIAVTSDAAAGPDPLISHADMAMYDAKKAGRNRYQVYDPAHCARAEHAVQRAMPRHRER